MLPCPTEDRIREALAKQVGEILQRPPQYSALKVKGQRAYDLARAGRLVDLEPRVVRIDRADLVSYSWPASGGGSRVRCGNLYPIDRPRRGRGPGLRRSDRCPGTNADRSVHPRGIARWGRI